MLPTTAPSPLQSILALLPDAFPSVINDTIGDYLHTGKDYVQATLPLAFDEQGLVINKRTRRVIKEALMSSDCPPAVTERIIRNAKSPFYKQVLNDIFDEIRCAGYRVNLAGIRLVNDEARYGPVVLDLTGLNFCGMCLIGAEIGVANMNGVNLKGADLSSAQLMDVTLVAADLSGAKLQNA